MLMTVALSSLPDPFITCFCTAYKNQMIVHYLSHSASVYEGLSTLEVAHLLRSSSGE